MFFLFCLFSNLTSRNFRYDAMQSWVTEAVGPGKGPVPLTFFQKGLWGGPNLRVFFYNNTSVRMYLKLNRPTIEIETREIA